MSEKLIEATVSRGRTVHADDKAFGPGEKVRLSEVDVKRLRNAGFLVNEAVPEIPISVGPNFNDGPQVVKVA